MPLFHYILSSIAISLLSLTSAVKFSAPSSWVHPGVHNSGPQLDFIKQKVASKTEPWNTAYNELLKDDSITGTTAPSPVPTVACGSSSHNPDVGCQAEGADALTAYTNALAFWISGKQSYAEKAITYMNAWAQTLKAHASTASGSTNTPLQSGWSAVPWTRAAEIIAYSNASWSESDITAFKNMLKTAYLPFLINGSTANGNWELVMMEAAQGIAIFLEDADVYTKAMDLYIARVPAYIYLGSDGALPIPAHGIANDSAHIIKYWNGQSTFVTGLAQETCRDLTHTGYGLASISNVAETSRIQGTDLFTTDIGERLRYGLGFHSGFAGNYTKVPSWLCGGGLKRELGPSTEVGYNALAFRGGNVMTDTGKYTVAQRPVGKSWPMASWETLTHAELPL